ncbi:MAG: hypothetical protein ACREB8_08575 [Pseudolabrys sp.]
MPTPLPRPPCVAQKKRSRARTAFDFLFNATLLVSGLIFAYVVLVREEQYVLGQSASPDRTIEQTAHRNAIDMTGETEVIPPSD